MTDDKDRDTTPTADPAAPRRVRRTRQVDAPAPAATPEAAAPEAAAPEAAAEAAPRPPRKPRTTPKEGASPRPAPGASGGRTAPRPPRAEGRSPRIGREAPAVSPLTLNRSSKKAIYRQDVVGTPPVMPAPEPKSTKQNPDQLMLVWHPAPKSAAPAKPKIDRPLTAKEALRAKLAKQAAGRKDAPKVEARASLEPAWIAVDAEGALDAARAAGAAGERLVQAWLEGANVAAIARLAGLDAAPGPARKAARRALNVLKSRGVDVAVPIVLPVRPVAAEEPSECEASFIPPDGNGTRFFSFTQRLPGGRFRVADVMVREGAGVVHANLGHLAGKHIRRWKARVEGSFGVAPVPVPLDWARAAVARGRQLNDVTKEIVPLGYDGCLPLLGVAPVVAPAHPVADLATPPSDEEIAAALAESERLHEEPEFATWGPERGSLQELVGKVGERLSSADAEDREKVDAVLREETDAATDRYFTPERREALADRLRDASISLRVRKGDAIARRVLVVAEAVRRAGLVTHAPRENGFLRGFFQKGMALLARENQGRLAIPARGGRA